MEHWIKKIVEIYMRVKLNKKEPGAAANHWLPRPVLLWGAVSCVLSRDRTPILRTPRWKDTFRTGWETALFKKAAVSDRTLTARLRRLGGWPHSGYFRFLTRIEAQRSGFDLDLSVLGFSCSGTVCGWFYSGLPGRIVSAECRSPQKYGETVPACLRPAPGCWNQRRAPPL